MSSTGSTLITAFILPGILGVVSLNSIFASVVTSSFSRWCSWCVWCRSWGAPFKPKINPRLIRIISDLAVLWSGVYNMCHSSRKWMNQTGPVFGSVCNSNFQPSCVLIQRRKHARRDDNRTQSHTRLAHILTVGKYQIQWSSLQRPIIPPADYISPC